MSDELQLLFDLGRVLVGWDAKASLRGLAEVSQASVEELGAMLDGPLSDAIVCGERSAAQLHAHCVRHFGATDKFDRFLEAFARGLSRDDGALAFALALSRRPGVRVGIISNTNDAHGVWLLRELPELKAFSPVLLSHQVGLAKPDPAIYELALDRAGIAPARALFVDDLPANVEAAQALGIAAQLHRDWDETTPAIERWLASGQRFAGARDPSETPV